MFGIMERWNNDQVTPSLSKPHELSYRSNEIQKPLLKKVLLYIFTNIQHDPVAE